MFETTEKGKTKIENYEIMMTNLEYFLSSGDTTITTLSNLSAFLNYFLNDVNWVGFYIYDGEKLTLGPFQGLPACTIIKLGSGVCGSSAKEQVTYVVSNVNEFPGHIACDANSNSEIVIPIIINNALFGVLDVDSPLFDNFDETDKIYLEKVITKLVDIIN